MKPSKIKSILDVAYELRKKGFKYNPLFSGDAGVGKSELCQQWVADKRKTNPKFGFIDLRLAVMDAQDFIGLPKVFETASGNRTQHVLPDFWPTEGEGLLLFEEPNRAHVDCMNALMQILTDRKVHHYSLPEGWVMAACINPDSSNYTVNTMDTALKNRFEIFDIRYDQPDFLAFMKAGNYDPNIISFIESGHWVYKNVDDVAATTEGFYISPRTWYKLNASRNSELVLADEDLHHETSVATLGKAIGTTFHKYVHEQKPLLARDFLGKKAAKSFTKLAAFSDPNKYRGDLLDITIKSVIEEFGISIDEAVVAKIAGILPADLAVNLLTDAFISLANKKREGKTKLELSFKTWIEGYPELKDSLKSRLKGSFKSKKAEETK